VEEAREEWPAKHRLLGERGDEHGLEERGSGQLGCEEHDQQCRPGVTGQSLAQPDHREWGGGEEDRGESDGPPGTGPRSLDGLGEHPADVVRDNVQEPEGEPLPEGREEGSVAVVVRGRLQPPGLELAGPEVIDDGADVAYGPWAREGAGFRSGGSFIAFSRVEPPWLRMSTR
jgi:hypothetical protein